MLKKYLFFLITAAFIVFPFLSSALEAEYPKIKGYTLSEQSTFPEYVKYIYYFAIAISGFIAVSMITWAGFIWLTSSGIPEKIKEARSKIISALLGIVILLFAVVLLRTINPRLTIMKLTPTEKFLPPMPWGIMLCKTEINIGRLISIYQEYNQKNLSKKQKDALVDQGINLLKEINEQCLVNVGTRKEIKAKTPYAYSIPNIKDGTIQHYGAIILQKRDFKGEPRFLGPRDANQPGYVKFVLPDYFFQKETGEKSEEENIFSIYTFKPAPGQEWRICLYKHVNFNRDYSREKPDCFDSVSYPDFLIGGYWRNFYLNEVGINYAPLSFKSLGPLISVFGKINPNNKEENDRVIFPTARNEANLLNYEEITNKKTVQTVDPPTETIELEPATNKIYLILGEIYY